MTREEIIELVRVWVAEIIDADEVDIGPDTDLVKDTGLDSLAIAELAAKLRARFKIKLRPGDLQQNLKVGPLSDFVLARVSGGA